MTTQTIKTVKTDSLAPYARNARTHSAAQIDQLAASIQEFGFLNPVIIDGDNVIIAGHGRVLAAQQLGLNEIPCVDASHLTEKQKRAYVIADNKLALNAGWDTPTLLDELSLIADDFDLNLVGFDDAFLDSLLSAQEYAPALEPQAASREVTQADMSKTEARLENAFADRSTQSMIEVICPSCAQEFTIRKD